MKTTRTLLIAAIGVLMMTPLLVADVNIDAQLRITPRPRADLEVYVWPDRGMDGVYYPGENINVNVEVTRDAFLILYNIDSRGHMRILFPSAPWEDNFVEAGDVISFPRAWDDYDWTIEGPAGTEYIQAIASEIPISLPEWPVYLQSVNSVSRIAPELRDFRSGSDRYHYIDVVNRNLCGRYYDWCATDVATFQVRPFPRYQHSYDYDPWPDVFYGEIYIGWPFGARIYVDNIYIGVAPCWIPRRYTGRRVITCYDGPRLIRRHEVNCFPKRDYYVNNRFGDSRACVYKKGRWDADHHFRYEKDYGKKNRYRLYDRSESWDDDDGRGLYKSKDARRGDNDYDDDNGRKKQDADGWRDDDLGKSNGKADQSRDKRSADDGQGNFKIVKPPTNTSADVKLSKSENPKAKRSVNNGSLDSKILTQPTSSDAGGRRSSKSESATVKRDDNNSTSNFKILKQPTSNENSAMRSAKSGAADAKRSESGQSAKSANARVETSSRNNDSKESVGTAKRGDSSARAKVAEVGKSDDAKSKSSGKNGKGSSSKRSKGGN